MNTRPDIPSSYKQQNEEAPSGNQETLIWIGVVVLAVAGVVAFTML